MSSTSEEIPQMLIDTQWDTLPGQDPLCDLTSHIWSLSMMNWQIICTDLEGSLVLNGVVILTHPWPDFAVHWVYLTIFNCLGTPLLLGEEELLSMREKKPTVTPWDFLYHLLLPIPITAQPQMKICLQEILYKLLSISKPFNFTTVSERLRFFYSHD